jgi:hypothetical protein
MSKSADSDTFARMVQAYLREKNLYGGPIDGWPGPRTQSAWRTYADLPGHAPPVTADEPVVGDLPEPASIYRLPGETNPAMTAFYGAPSASPNYLDWFSFPHPQTRLYTRTGTLLRDRAGDERLDHQCHRLLTGRLTAALAEIYATLGRAEFERQGWHVYGGCHNYREKRGGSTLSTHAWGIALDMNPNENTLRSSSTSFSPAAVDIMEKWGFLSGGRAWGRDWMHFQAAIPSISPGSHYHRHGLPKSVARA